MTVEDARYSHSSDKNRLLLLALAEAWGSNCYWCRKPKTFRDLQIDDILPRNPRGGRDLEFDVDAAANLAPICGPCNQEKSNGKFDDAPRFDGARKRAAQLTPQVERARYQHSHCKPRNSLHVWLLSRGAALLAFPMRQLQAVWLATDSNKLHQASRHGWGNALLHLSNGVLAGRQRQRPITTATIGGNSLVLLRRSFPVRDQSIRLPSMFAATCGNFRDMRLAGAFFANKADVVNDMLNVEGGFWSSTTVPAGAASFECHCVVLCDTRRRDVGTQYTLHIDAAGPTGQRWAPAWSKTFLLPSAMKFMVLTQIALPLEPGGGRHVYSFRLEGSHERFDIPLYVVIQ